ncbi:MAG: PHP domain-containing protein [Clostridia bacterium]|nr:PHP domain-containing protein [Clostridia bacterium]
MPELRCDLHTHSTNSDGVLTPSELVRKAAAAGIDCLALSDHDTTSGVREAEEDAGLCGIQVIPAVELSCGEDGETHILGYGDRPDATPLLRLFEKRKQDRIERFYQMAGKLKALGFPLDEEAILHTAGESVGRPHLARALVSAGYFQDTTEVFDRLLGNDRPAYVPQDLLHVEDALLILTASGFVPILAHPSLLPDTEDSLLRKIDAWLERGLAGIEVYHPANGEKQGFSYYRKISEDRRLLITGGSDYHDDQSHAPLGSTADAWFSAKEDVAALRENIQKLNERL